MSVATEGRRQARVTRAAWGALDRAQSFLLTTIPPCSVRKLFPALHCSVGSAGGRPSRAFFTSANFERMSERHVSTSLHKSLAACTRGLTPSSKITPILMALCAAASSSKETKAKLRPCVRESFAPNFQTVHGTTICNTELCVRCFRDAH